VDGAAAGPGAAPQAFPTKPREIASAPPNRTRAC
jgi:hypothetical protein